MTDLLVGQISRETLNKPGEDSVHVGFAVRETLMQQQLPPTDMRVGFAVRETLLKQPTIPTEMQIGFISRETLLVPDATLKLVSLYPIAPPSDVYALSNTHGADFPSFFSQFSLSMWCCEFVNLRGPNGINSPYGFDMRFNPAQAHVEFYDLDTGSLLFSGTFNNPGRASKLYHVMLSIDTQAHLYTFWVSGVQWPSTDAAFAMTGFINNEAN